LSRVGSPSWIVLVVPVRVQIVSSHIFSHRLMLHFLKLYARSSPNEHRDDYFIVVLMASCSFTVE